MTPYQIQRARPLEAWRTGLALWSTLAQAPSRVATAQARMALRLMQAAAPWPAARAGRGAMVGGPVVPVVPEVVPAEAEVEAPVAVEVPAAVEAAPQVALAEASLVAIAAATAEEPLPEVAELAVPEPVAALAEPESQELGGGAVIPLRTPEDSPAEEPAFALAEAAPKAARAPRTRAPSGGARARKPRRG